MPSYLDQAIIPFKTKMLAIFLIGMILLFVISLIRKGRLREEYSFIWFFVVFITFVLTIWTGGLIFLTKLIGASDAAYTVFFCGLLFLIMMALYFTVVLSKLKLENKNMVQEIAILKYGVEKLTKNGSP